MTHSPIYPSDVSLFLPLPCLKIISSDYLALIVCQLYSTLVDSTGSLERIITILQVRKRWVKASS